MFVFINYKMINDPQDPVPSVAHVCMQALPFRSFFSWGYTGVPFRFFYRSLPATATQRSHFWWRFFIYEYLISGLSLCVLFRATSLQLIRAVIAIDRKGGGLNEKR